MKTRRMTAWAAAVCALAIAGTAQAGFPWFKGGSDVPTLTKDMMWKGWKTSPASWQGYSGAPCRMGGEVTSRIKQGQGYWLECNGEPIAVLVPVSGMQKASLPMKNDLCFVLGGFTPAGNGGNGFIEEVIRYPLDGTAGVTEDDWNGWLDEAGYDFAVENAYRRLAVVADNGKRMPALDAIDWQKMRSEGTDLLVTEEAEILKFLKDNQAWWKQLQEWCAKNKAALIVAALVVIVLIVVLAVVMILSRPRKLVCPRCGRPVAECICQPEKTCPVCGLPLSQCRGHVVPEPAGNGGNIGGGNVGGGNGGGGNGGGGNGGGGGDDDDGETEIKRMVLRIDGVPLAKSDATVVLSPFALKVTKGGKNAGTVLPLPKMATLLGREKGDVSGAFIRLDMSDRKAIEKQCSRRYARITAHADSLDVEVVATSGNEIRVDGQVASNEGEVLQAKLGSRIELNPDWEFEVVPAKARG